MSSVFWLNYQPDRVVRLSSWQHFPHKVTSGHVWLLSTAVTRNLQMEYMISLLLFSVKRRWRKSSCVFTVAGNSLEAFFLLSCIRSTWFESNIRTCLFYRASCQAAWAKAHRSPLFSKAPLYTAVMDSEALLLSSVVLWNNSSGAPFWTHSAKTLVLHSPNVLQPIIRGHSGIMVFQHSCSFAVSLINCGKSISAM